jgi:hypothetical protein
VSSPGTPIKIVVLQNKKKKKQRKEMRLEKGRAEGRGGGEQGTSPQFPSYCVTNSHGMLIRQRERSTGHVTRSIRLPTVVDLTCIGNLGRKAPVSELVDYRQLFADRTTGPSLMYMHLGFWRVLGAVRQCMENIGYTYINLILIYEIMR